jgi:hypothetical protein
MTSPAMPVGELWNSKDAQAWHVALEQYWSYVRDKNRELERSLDKLDLNRVRGFDARSWFDFLLNEYFPWKYTAPNRLATTTKYLKQYQAQKGLAALDDIRQRLLNFDRADIRKGLQIAREVKGLGIPGASGLLSLMYPTQFGTVDQFVVKTLRDVTGLPEAAHLERMNSDNLSEDDGVILIGILRRKAAQLNELFATTDWTPRKIDKVLWTYGR